MRVPVAGILRVLLVAAAGAGLVQLSATNTVGLDVGSGASRPEDAATGQTLVSGAGLACSGAELTGIRGVRNIDQTVSIRAAVPPAALLPKAPGKGSLQIAVGDAEATVTTRDETASARANSAAAVTVSGSGGLAPGLAADQSWVLDTATIRGLAATPCGRGLTDAWLVAGGGGVGRLERLVLANPSANPVTALVTVHGTSGLLTIDGQSVSVPAFGRTALLVEALAPGEKAPAVHVTASGAGLWPTLTDTWLDGLDPQGADTTRAGAAPARSQVIPGVVADGDLTLRVLNPGEGEAVVSGAVVGPEGLVPIKGNAVARVNAGATAEIVVPGLTDGTYAVRVTADVPVVAAAMGGHRRGAGGEFAWAPSTVGIDGLAGAVLPTREGLTSTLALVGGATPAQVELTVVDGATSRTRVLPIPAGATVAVPLAGAGSVWVRPLDDEPTVHAAVRLTLGAGADRLEAVLPLSPTVLTSALGQPTAVQ